MDEVYCKDRALNYLARREHSQQELAEKLCHRGFEPAMVQSILENLVKQNLLSDLRFAQCYTAERVRRGNGPLRIQQELYQRGVNETIIESVLAEYQDEWLTHAQTAWEKYQRTHPDVVNSEDLNLKKQKFLYMRGYYYNK